MSDEQGYNGWKNYETWAMALWIDNDQASYTYSRGTVTALMPTGTGGQYVCFDHTGWPAKLWDYQELETQ